MNDLDQTIRDGLRAATDGVDGVDPEELAHRLERRRAAVQSPQVAAVPQRRRRRLALGVAAAALIAVIAAVALRSGADERTSRQDVVADDPQPTTSAAASTTTAPVSTEQPAPVSAMAAPVAPVGEWGPGWYQLDTAGLPATTAAPVWFEGDLLVTATPADEFPDGTRVYRRDQLTGAWSEMARLPLVNAAIVAAGDRLVAVGMQGYVVPPLPPAWAILDEAGSEWLLQGEARPDASAAMTNFRGPTLLWTGERVLDVADAVVLDPETGRADELEVPDEEGLALLIGDVVWTGDRAVAPRWNRPGWAWDRLGRYLGEIRAVASVPAAEGPDGGAAVATDGAVIVTAGPPVSSGVVARALAPDTAQWTDVVAPPTAPLPADADTFAQCRSWLAATAQRLLSLACNVGGFRSAEYVAGRWTPIGVPEVVSSSQITGVQHAEDHVVVALEVAPPEGSFAAPTTAMLIWVPDR